MVIKILDIFSTSRLPMCVFSKLFHTHFAWYFILINSKHFITTETPQVSSYYKHYTFQTYNRCHFEANCSGIRNNCQGLQLFAFIMFLIISYNNHYAPTPTLCIWYVKMLLQNGWKCKWNVSSLPFGINIIQLTINK